MNALNSHFVFTSLVSRLSRADAAVRLLASGPCAGRHFTALLFVRETTFTPERFRILLCVYESGLICPWLLSSALAGRAWTSRVATDQLAPLTASS